MIKKLFNMIGILDSIQGKIIKWGFNLPFVFTARFNKMLWSALPATAREVRIKVSIKCEVFW